MPRQTCVIVKNNLDTEWYSDKKIDNVLSHALSGKKDVVALKAIPLEGSDYFADALKEAARLATEKGKTVLMPINIHEDHWVGGMMKMEGKKLKFFHNDSLGNAMDPTMKGKIERAGIEIIDLKAQQQNDNYNCGPLTIHNLLEMSKAESLEEDELKRKLLESAKGLDLQQLRKDHSGLSAYQSDETKEKEICGEMRGIFKTLQEQGKVSEENGNKRFDCDSSKDAKELAEKIKKSYENLGVPCNLQEKDGQWIVKIPAACKGKDVFLMDSDQLEDLREEIQAEQSVAKENPEQEKAAFGKFTKMALEKGKEAKGKASDGRE
jgi:hypothetical protein